MTDFEEMVRKVTVRYNDKIKRLCAPLYKNFDLSHFWYYKLTNSGHYCFLGTHAEWAEYFVSEKCYLSYPYFRSPDRFDSGVSLIRSLEQVSLSSSYDHGNFSKVMGLGREKFNLHSSLQIHYRTQEGMEVFGFGCSRPDEMQHMRFINELPLLRLFAKQIKEKEQQLFKELEDSQIDLAALLGPLFYEPTIAVMPNPVCRRSFFKDVCNIRLTPREIDVVTLLLKGYSAPEIADELVLSTRTIEHYIENIKVKLSCSSRSDLIKRARELEFLGYF